MKVKVGDKVYDGEDVPVMAMFSWEDKLNLAGKIPSKYCSYPDDMDPGKAVEFMALNVMPKPPAPPNVFEMPPCDIDADCCTGWLEGACAQNYKRRVRKSKRHKMKACPECVTPTLLSAVFPVCPECGYVFENMKQEEAKPITEAGMQDLFDYMSEYHGLTLTQTEMHDMIAACKPYMESVERERVKITVGALEAAANRLERCATNRADSLYVELIRKTILENGGGE